MLHNDTSWPYFTSVRAVMVGWNAMRSSVLPSRRVPVSGIWTKQAFVIGSILLVVEAIGLLKSLTVSDLLTFK